MGLFDDDELNDDFMDDELEDDYMDDDYVYLHEHPEMDVANLYTAETRSEEDSEEEDEDLLILTGYSRIDLEFMDEDERNEILEDAGLDPDDYDFD